jgi:hypothetical protein
MKLKIRNSCDFIGGSVIAAVGASAMFASRDYSMGTAMQMGPGYFPFYLGAIAVLIGAAISATAFRIEGEPMGKITLRPLVMLSAAFIAFALLVDTVGFVVALIATIFCASLGAREFRIGEFLALSAVLVVGCIALFVWGLGLPFKLFW